MYDIPKYKTRAHAYKPESVFEKHENLLHTDRTLKLKTDFHKKEE